MALTTIESLTADDRQRLSESLECTDAELDERLKLCSLAALSEHLDMFLGRKLSSAASDFREYRLFKLIEARVFGVPTDQNVADLFQLTLPQARTLIRNVYTKYRFELSAGRDLLLKQTLASAQADPNDEARFFLTIGSRAIADALNDRLLRYGGGARLTLSRGSQTQYTIDKASLSTLVEKLGATPAKDL